MRKAEQSDYDCPFCGKRLSWAELEADYCGRCRRNYSPDEAHFHISIDPPYAARQILKVLWLIIAATLVVLIIVAVSKWSWREVFGP